jgi:hypothetical protein
MHRFIPDATATAGPSLDATEETAALKRWTRRFLDLAPEAVISVHTTTCADPGCPVAETTVIVQSPGASPRGWRFQRTRVALSRVVVEQVLATPGFIIPHCDFIPARGTVAESGGTAPPARTDRSDH